MVPQLGFWERADLRLGQLNILANVLYAAITGVFRGKSSPKFYRSHLIATAIRTMVDRISARQSQYVHPCPNCMLLEIDVVPEMDQTHEQQADRFNTT